MQNPRKIDNISSWGNRFRQFNICVFLCVCLFLVQNLFIIQVEYNENVLFFWHVVLVFGLGARNYPLNISLRTPYQGKFFFGTMCCEQTYLLSYHDLQLRKNWTRQFKFLLATFINFSWYDMWYFVVI